MPVSYACTVCGRALARPGMCVMHGTARGANTTRRGYGYHHQQRRKHLLSLAIGRRCEICGMPMTQGQALDLDHSVPLSTDMTSVGDRIVHASCNRGRA